MMTFSPALPMLLFFAVSGVATILLTWRLYRCQK